MHNYNLTQTPISKTAMLIRKPIANVFEAFIDPQLTTKFWFTKSSGRLEEGKEINLFQGNKLMNTQEQVYDSPTKWVGDHIRQYVESDGEKGHDRRGMHTLLLTTRGRKSGKLRRTALIYGQDGNNYLIVASNGGADNHPLWYLNLSEDPAVQIQVGADTLGAHARTASAEEKPRLWQIMSKIFPTYDSYVTKASKAGRDIPLVILEPLVLATVK
jgi:deazaflavin-dependent oxidoreductase (nitroreductase family)